MTDSIDPEILAALESAGLSPAMVADVVDRALAEDLAGGADVTTAATIGSDQVGQAEAVPREAGVLSTRPERLWDAVRTYLHDEDAARLAGKAARAAALERYGLARFLRDWDRLLGEVTR